MEWIALIVSIISLLLSFSIYIRNEWYESRFRRPFIELVQTSINGDNYERIQLVFKNSGKHPTGKIDLLMEIFMFDKNELVYAINSNLVTPFPTDARFNQCLEYPLGQIAKESKVMIRILIEYTDYFFNRKMHKQRFWLTYVNSERHFNNSRQEEIDCLQEKIIGKTIKINPDLPGYNKEIRQ